MLRDVVDRVLLKFLLALLRLLVVLGSRRHLVRRLASGALALRLDVSGALSLAAAAGSSTPVEGEVNLLRRRVDLDGGRERGGCEVTIDLAETRDRARTGRERVEQMRRGRVARDTTKDDAAPAMSITIESVRR